MSADTGDASISLAGSNINAENELLLRNWIFEEFSNSRKVLKLSDAKDKFPTIHMKWIELAFDSFESEQLLLIPPVRSRIKMYEINPSRVPATSTKRPLESTTEIVASKTKAPKSDPAVAPASPSKVAKSTLAAMSPSKSNVASPSKASKVAKLSKRSEVLRSEILWQEELQQRIQDSQQLRSLSIANCNDDNNNQNSDRSMQGVTAQSMPADPVLISSKQAVCALLNDIFDLLLDESYAQESTYKAELLRQLREYNEEHGISASDSVDSRFITHYYQTAQQSDSSVVAIATALPVIMSALETENRIFVDGHEVYQI